MSYYRRGYGYGYSYGNRSGGGVLTSLFLVLVFGLVWLSVAAWRSMHARSGSVVWPTLALALTWICAGYWLTLPGPNHPETIAALAKRVARSDIACMREAREYQRGFERSRFAYQIGDQVEHMASVIAAKALRDKIAPADVSCTSDLERLAGIARAS